MEKFSCMPTAQDALFESHYKEMGKSFKALMESNPSPDVGAILESFDTTPYALDEKIVKGKGDISYVFKDETGDRYRIQFLAAPKFGKGVVKVYIGKGKGGRLFVDKIDRFTNPKAMIATVINFFTEHLLSPEGMGLRGFIVDLSGAASIRSIPILKKVIKSALISKIKVADDTFQPQEGRKYLWITKSTLKPADVFNGPGSEGAPWLQGKEKAGDQSTDKKGDAAGVKSAKFDPMTSVQALIDQVLPSLKRKFKDITLTPSLNNQMKWVSVTANVDGQPVTNFMFEYKRIKSNGADMEPKYVASEITEYVEKRMKQIADAQKKAKEESERAMNLKKDPAFYLKQQQAAIEGEINLKVKGFNFKLEFSSSGKIVKARVLENGSTPIDYVEFTAPNAKEDDEEMRDFAISQIMKILKKNGYMKGRKAGLLANQPVKVTNFSRYGRGFKTEGDVDYGVLTSAEETFGNVLMNKNNVNHKVDWVDIVPHSGAADGGQTKTQTQTASGKKKEVLSANAKAAIDSGLKEVKDISTSTISAKSPNELDAFVIIFDEKGDVRSFGHDFGMTYMNRPHKAKEFLESLADKNKVIIGDDVSDEKLALLKRALENALTSAAKGTSIKVVSTRSQRSDRAAVVTSIVEDANKVKARLTVSFSYVVAEDNIRTEYLMFFDEATWSNNIENGSGTQFTGGCFLDLAEISRGNEFEKKFIQAVVKR